MRFVLMFVTAFSLLVSLFACGSNEVEPKTVSSNSPANRCKVAYDDLERLHLNLGLVTKHTDKIIEKAEFVRHCEAWSDRVIRCLKLEYQLAHYDECQQAWSDISKQDRKALWKLPDLPAKP